MRATARARSSQSVLRPPRLPRRSPGRWSGTSPRSTSCSSKGFTRRARRSAAQAGGRAVSPRAARDARSSSARCPRATSSSSSRPPETACDVAFVDPDAGETDAARRPVGRQHRVARRRSARVGRPSWRRWRRSGSGLLPLVESWVAAGRPTRSTTTREPGFWERGDRAETLAFVEYVDRLEAAWRTGERLAERLGRGNGRPTADGVRLLAQRLYLLERALAGLEQRRAADAFVRVAPGRPNARRRRRERVRGRDRARCTRRWAAARGMRLRACRRCRRKPHGSRRRAGCASPSSPARRGCHVLRDARAGTVPSGRASVTGHGRSRGRSATRLRDDLTRRRRARAR